MGHNSEAVIDRFMNKSASGEVQVKFPFYTVKSREMINGYLDYNTDEKTYYILGYYNPTSESRKLSGTKYLYVDPNIHSELLDFDILWIQNIRKVVTSVKENNMSKFVPGHSASSPIDSDRSTLTSSGQCCSTNTNAQGIPKKSFI